MTTPSEFLKILWGEIPPGKVLIWTLPDKKSRWYPHFETITADMRFHEYEDVYTGIGLAPWEGMRLASNKRLREWEVAAITAFWADIDVAHPVHKTAKQYPPSIERAMEAIAQLPFEATIIVNSGHGLQLWWVLKEIWLFADAEEREQARRACQWWHRLVKETFAQFGWDVDSTFDLPRVMRLPGTWNNKNPQERKRVEVTGGSGTRYGRELFTQLVPEDFKATPMGARRSTSRSSARFSTEGSRLVLDPEAQPSFSRMDTLLKLEPKFRATWEKNRPDLSDPSPSAYDMALANYAVKAGWPDQEIANLMVAFRRKHGLDLKLREKYYALTIGKAHEPMDMDRNAVSTRGPDTPVPTAATLDPLRPENLKPAVPSTEIIGTAKRDITTYRGSRGHNARVKAIQDAVEGSQTETLCRMLVRAHAAGETDMTPYSEAARNTGLDEDEIQRALDSGLDPDPKEEAGTSGSESTAGASRDAGNATIGGFIPLKQRPVITRNSNGLAVALTYLQEDIRWNDREKLVERMNERRSWEALDEPFEAALQERIAENLAFRGANGPSPAYFGDATWRRALNALLNSRRVDPWQEWLHSKPEWNGQSRAERIFIDTLGAADTRLNREAGKRWLIAIVARTEDPDNEYSRKHDWMPVIIGGPGGGKSSVARHIIPPNPYGWFVDQIFFDMPMDKIIEKTYGAVVGEFTEMAGLHRRELSKIKSFVSAEEDKVRLSYDRRTSVLPRRWVGIGTANDNGNGVLPEDPTGNRRWIAIKTTATEGNQPAVKAWCEENRDQVWAEALHLYRAGEPWDLPKDLLASRDAVNSEYELKDENLLDLLENLRRDHDGTGYSLAHIQEVGKFPPGKRGQLEVVPYLVKEGWTKKRPDGGPRLWFPPEEPRAGD